MDERFRPYPDQWEFLSSIRRITRREVEEIVRLAEAKGKVIGVRLAPADAVNADSAEHVAAHTLLGAARDPSTLDMLRYA